MPNSREGLAGAKYTTFRSKSLDLSWDGTVYRSITDAPRVRFVTSGNLKIELGKDLYWSFRLYKNYDTKPPVNAPKNDLGVATSLGFQFYGNYSKLPVAPWKPFIACFSSHFMTRIPS